MVAVATEGLPVLAPAPLGRSSAPRRALLCVLVGLAVAGCTGAGAGQDPVAAPVSPSPVETSAPQASPTSPPPVAPTTAEPSASAPATASSSPTPTPTETFAPTDDPPPELMLTGEDFDAVIRSYHAYRDWAYMHPDPSRLDAIMHPDCECIIQKDLPAHYVEQGQWWVAEPTVVHSVEVVDDFAPNVVILRITLEHTDTQQLIDSEGTVHEVLEPRPPWVEENVYVRDDETSPWRLRSFLDLLGPWRIRSVTDRRAAGWTTVALLAVVGLVGAAAPSNAGPGEAGGTASDHRRGKGARPPGGGRVGGAPAPASASSGDPQATAAFQFDLQEACRGLASGSPTNPVDWVMPRSLGAVGR